jgi:hypothetical protein
VKNVESKTIYYRDNGDVWHLTVFPGSLRRDYGYIAKPEQFGGLQSTGSFCKLHN